MSTRCPSASSTSKPFDDPARGDRLRRVEIEAARQRRQALEHRRVRCRPTIHRTTTRWPATCGGVPPRCGPRRSTAGSVDRAAPRSATGPSSAPVPRPTRSPTESHPVAHRSHRSPGAGCHRSIAPACVARSMNNSTASVPSANGGTARTRSAAIPNGSRLVANTRTPGALAAKPIDEPGDRAEDVLAVVDDHQQLLRLQAAHQRGRQRLAGLRRHPQHLGDRSPAPSRHAPAAPTPPPTPRPRTAATPPRRPPTPDRVLPTPPTPVNVTNRCSASNAATASTSTRATHERRQLQRQDSSAQYPTTATPRTHHHRPATPAPPATDPATDAHRDHADHHDHEPATPSTSLHTTCPPCADRPSTARNDSTSTRNSRRHATRPHRYATPSAPATPHAAALARRPPRSPRPTPTRTPPPPRHRCA